MTCSPPYLRRHDAGALGTARLACAVALLTGGCGGGGADDPVAPPPIPVASVRVSPKQSTLEIGETKALSAAALDANGNNLGRPINWTSLDPTIASVGAGLMTAVAPGTARIVASSEARADTATVTVITGSQYSIDVRYLTDAPLQLRTSITAAITRWRRVIRGDISDTPVTLAAGRCGSGSPAISESIDDLLVLVEVGPLAGFTGFSFVCWTRSNGLPLVARIKFNSDDIPRMFVEGWGDNLVLHEFGHAVGMLDGIWASRGLADFSDLSNPRFTGENAKLAFRALIDGYPVGSPVPLENVGPPGTIRTHWRRSLFDGEVMTHWVFPTSVLSGLTIASLQDLGYEVNRGAAEQFRGRSAAEFPAGGFELKEQAIAPIGYIDIRGTAVRYPIR